MYTLFNKQTRQPVGEYGTYTEASIVRDAQGFDACNYSIMNSAELATGEYEPHAVRLKHTEQVISEHPSRKLANTAMYAMREHYMYEVVKQ